MQGHDAGEELVAAFEAISNVLAAQGRLRQKRSRPLRARLTITCPKVPPEAGRTNGVIWHQAGFATLPCSGLLQYHLQAASSS